MENTSEPIEKLSQLASLLLEKLKAQQTDLSLEFNNVSLQGPGPQGQPGEWRLNGQLNLKATSTGLDQK
ncbi:hypothetical protein [Rufibacter sp. LB8]|uniref:hypothetical protein n=1 Tax=Rufibacter sp. LB8 TaxID=2777781 RepID=UPI00178C6DD2|nr:hypothetical protein [Rufibacter sp. LB8]